MKKLDVWICKAEIAYKGGNIKCAIKHANSALGVCADPAKEIALRIFIARAYSRLGCYDKSNTIYRELLRENAYIPLVIMGLLYNNFKNPEKQKNSVRLMKLCLRLR